MTHDPNPFVETAERRRALKREMALDTRERWQQHYDEFMASIEDEGRAGILTPIAAEQYADDMMEEEEQNNGAA